MPEATAEQLERLVDAVMASPKYRSITRQLVAFISEGQLSKGLTMKEAVKATRNKLHQVGGAYLERPPDYSAWLEDLRAAWQASWPEFQLACRQVMSQHASTRERLGHLDVFYPTVLAEIPPPGSVLDIACGLNPLSLPWMGLSDQVEYLAVDIYHDMAAFLNGFFSLLPVRGEALAADVLSSLPPGPFDLAILLKAIPCLEQIDKAAGARLLGQIQAPNLLVSFPVYSLGGRARGMRQNYEAHFQELVAGKGWQVRRYDFPNELAFLLRKG